MRRDVEGQIQRAICGYLTTVLDPAVAEWFAICHENDGTARMNARMNANGRKPGTPDMQVVHDGRALFIEVKSPVGRQSASQRDFEARIVAVGASYGIARSVDDVVALLDTWGVPTRARSIPHEGKVA